MPWSPHITVAAVLERDGRFLIVEEHADGGIRFNQPAGHLEPDESLLAGAIRETLEETAHHFRPTALLGIYTWSPPGKDLTYFRFAFTGEVIGHDLERALDDGIVAAHWLTLSELHACRERHRSPLVLRCVEDFLAGRRFPLDLIAHFPTPVNP